MSKPNSHSRLMTVKSQQLLFNEDDVDFLNPFSKLSFISYVISIF